MSQYQRIRQRNRSQQRLGVLLLVLVPLATAAIFGVAWWLQQARGQVKPETLCPIGGSPAYVAVVFDKSDSYNPVQQRYLERFFEHFKASLAVGTRVSLFVIDGRQAPIAPDFVVCNPGSGQGANPLYQNPARIQRRWEEGFERPLDDAIAAAMAPATAPVSPIMEMLQKVALSAFPPPGTSGQPAGDPVPKRVILISDMLQNTPEWSHYRGQLNFEALRETAYFQRVRTDLQGAEVQVLYVRRPGREALQTKRHALFWADYIAAIGGRLTLVERVDG